MTKPMTADNSISTESWELRFGYTNWEGRNSERRVKPISVRYGQSKWHPRDGWLMLALDLDKNEEREFSMRDMVMVERSDPIPLGVAQTRVNQEAMDWSAGEAGKIEDYKATNPDWDSKTRPARDVLAAPETCTDCGKIDPCDDDCPNFVEPSPPAPLPAGETLADRLAAERQRRVAEIHNDSMVDYLVGFDDATEAALASPPHVQIAGEAWQPIETCPKIDDAHYFLFNELWEVEGWANVERAYWFEHTWIFDSGLTLLDCDTKFNPTMWHPDTTPAAPVSSSVTSTLCETVSQASYCALCDLEHPLHEDAQGFHHVVKGARIACVVSSTPREAPHD